MAIHNSNFRPNERFYTGCQWAMVPLLPMVHPMDFKIPTLRLTSYITKINLAQIRMA